MLSTTVKGLLKLICLAEGLIESTAPSLQFCVDQNINSLALRFQFSISSKSWLNTSNVKPTLVKYF